MKATFIIMAIWFSTIAYAQAESQTFQSTDTRVNIIELYTSEGCSSCPPADRWLSKFKNDDRLWKEFIPVAFHVDYWNYIGWPDRFAAPEYGQRQRNYAIESNLSTVYTPGVMLNGKEWRARHYKRALVLDKTKGVGNLNVVIDGEQLMASFITEHRDNSAFLNVSILGFDLITTVKAGENSGRELQHDFVVLGYQRIPMNDSTDGYTLTTELPEVVENAQKTGLAVWVDSGSDLTPVQATGGWLAER